MKFAPDAWLADIFGYDVIRVALENEETIESETIFQKDAPRRAFFYAKIPVTSVSQVGALTKAGFRVTDVNVTFERKPAQLANSNKAVLVRDVRAEDEADVLAIAESAFVFSRFHLDPFIPKELANKIKREWIANYICGQRGERLLVAEENGKIAGFLALLATGVKKEIGVIDLIGVSKSMQGRGVGQSLVEYHIREACQKYSNLIVGTQIANAPSMRLYQKCGYSVSNSAYVLHAHINEGKVL